MKTKRKSRKPQSVIFLRVHFGENNTSCCSVPDTKENRNHSVLRSLIRQKHPNVTRAEIEFPDGTEILTFSRRQKTVQPKKVIDAPPFSLQELETQAVAALAQQELSKEATC